ncbi:MAG: hypothetical protein LBH95_01540 [Oscillospiraceae bacterium]|nr:hypothetical protein [Oscillospiraceae bacterium]
MKLAVIGDPIAHSLSPAIHKAVFDELGWPLVYSSHRVEKGKLGEWLPVMREEGIDGFNVTMPHKADIIPFCGAVHAKSVNTVTVRNGALTGYSTDENGFLLSLRERGFSVAGKTAVIAGRGGVTATLSAALEEAGATVHSVSVRGTPSQPLGELPALLASVSPDLFVNATPLGMKDCPDNWKDLAFLRGLPKYAVVYDLIYNPPQTVLLREAAVLGFSTVNGLDMLIYQAILSDEIYLERELDTPRLKKTVLRYLQRYSNHTL